MKCFHTRLFCGHPVAVGDGLTDLDVAEPDADTDSSDEYMH